MKCFAYRLTWVVCVNFCGKETCVDGVDYLWCKLPVPGLAGFEVTELQNHAFSSTVGRKWLSLREVEYREVAQCIRSVSVVCHCQNKVLCR